MLEAVKIKNFKIFDEIGIPLKPLSVLLGGNGAGKSSFLQSLLLVRQAFEEGSVNSISLNGTLVQLGVGRDVLRQGADVEEIEISFTEDSGAEHAVTLAYEAEADTPDLKQAASLPSSLCQPSFTYLTAERIGPRLVAPRSIQSASRRHIGPRGEGALAVLDHHRALILPTEDPRRKGMSGSLEEIFQEYLSSICPTARIELQPYTEVDSIGSSYIFTPPGGLPSLPVRPTNVGFGLSYSMPIIVAALVAEPGSILIVENPEAHLHTASQRAMIDLLHRTSQAGVQVIVETHSRELFHWLRNNASQGLVDGDRVCLNYFHASYDAGGRVTSCSTLSPVHAPLGKWPQHFYDEYGSPSDLIAPVAM